MKADLRFLQYTPDFISGTMSLREPQKISLEVLANILQVVPPEKGIDLKGALQKVYGLYPTCTDFEREFLSLLPALYGATWLRGYAKHRHDVPAGHCRKDLQADDAALS